MENTHTYQLIDFITELSAFSFSDVLVNLDIRNKAVFEIDFQQKEEITLPYNNHFNQLYKIAVQNKKTADIQSLCAAHSLLHWKIKDRIVHTPLFLIPVQSKFNKIKQEFQIRFDYENVIINPFITHYLKKEFDFQLPLVEFNQLPENAESVARSMKEKGFELECLNFMALGNFHYHRYELIKDLEEIIKFNHANNLVQTLLGETPSQEVFPLHLSTKNCFETDIDQQRIFETFSNENIVIQGPPGTGKTQVLSNLISKLLLRNKNQLVVSEKKTALTVLEQKLRSKKLHHFVFLSHSQSKSADFIQKLKSTWNFLEHWDHKPEANLQLSEQYLKQIQLTFDKLNQISFWGSYSLQEIQQFSQTKVYDSLPFITGLPTMNEWEGLKVPLKSIYTNVKNIDLIGKLKQVVLQQHKHPDELLDKIIQKYNTLQSLFQADTLEEYRELNKKALVLQILYNEQHKKYAHLLNSEKEWKKVEKLKRKYQVLSQRQELADKELLLWEKQVTGIEVESWIQLLKSGTWVQKRRVKKQIKTRLSSNTINYLILLKQTKAQLDWKDEWLTFLQKCSEIGIENPENDFLTIDYIYREQQKLKEDQALNSIRELSEEQHNQVLSKASLIRTFLRDIDDYFNVNEQESLKLLLSRLVENLEEVYALKSHLVQLPAIVYKNLNRFTSVEEFEQLVLKSNWILFSSNFPDLAAFTGEKLHQKLNQIEQEEKYEQALFAQEIIAFRKNKFQEYHRLLQTSATKLSENEKQLKKTLKVGKTLLVKEFSKRKQHRSIRELMASEARIWIDLLTPVQLSTPSHLSKNIPLEDRFFECVIFDEASQIPLPKAISALQRAERVLIAGDSQQMAPSTFFSSMKSGVDLLHQATYYLNQQSLKHHYRSMYSELIAFSNKHFYKDELIVYPTSKTIQPVQWHFVESGIFEDRQNIEEAKSVARQIEIELKEDKTIGVVAFSEHQLNCIWKQIHPAYYAQLEEKIQQEKIFFKALEQVQGEECETLIISLAYGKNSKGEFHHRFGPLNQKSGSKRLNVLFTRAIRQIHFFSSVCADDFQLSSNEAINLLRLYLIEIAKDYTVSEIKLPMKIKATHENGCLYIPGVNRQIPHVSELKTFHSVMQKRGWKLKYEV